MASRVYEQGTLVVLENSYLHVSIDTLAGGRISGLFDKRSGTEMPSGWVLALGADHVIDGRVAFRLEEPETGDDEAAVWLGQAVTRTGMSWQLRVALPPDRAVIEFEARIVNRTFGPVYYNGGLAMTPGH